MTAPAPTSIGRYAPVGDMALYFDGRLHGAAAVLPAGTLADDPSDFAFSFTFWFRPGPAPWTVDGAGDSQGGSGSAGAPLQTLLDLRGPSGPLLVLGVAAGGHLDCFLPGSSPDTTVLDLAGLPDGWLFALVSYSPAQGADVPAALTLAVTDGGPAVRRTPAPLTNPLRPARETRTLTVGRPAGDDPPRTPYQGMLARLRLWRLGLDSSAATAAMYADPLGHRSFTPGPLAADWRMNEGFGDTAFDYAATGPDLLPARYEPPPGSHLTLGRDGVPGTEPVWVVAGPASLVRASSTQPLAHLLAGPPPQAPPTAGPDGATGGASA